MKISVFLMSLLLLGCGAIGRDVAGRRSARIFAQRSRVWERRLLHGLRSPVWREDGTRRRGGMRERSVSVGGSADSRDRMWPVDASTALRALGQWARLLQ